MTVLKRVVVWAAWVLLGILGIILLGHIAINTYLKRDHGLTDNEGVLHTSNLYFAYGANMSLRYLKNIRNVEPEGWSAGTVNGYKLTFGVQGINDLEPGFANIATCEDDCSVSGIVYALSDDQFNNIINSEPDEYKVESVPVELPDGNVVTAKVLVGPEQGSFTPSKRYVSIMIDGATEGGVSEDYVKSLSNLETVYTPVLSDLLGTVIYTVVYMQARQE